MIVVLHRVGAPTALKRRALELFGLELAQGLVGYVQYFTGVPGPLVILHMLGAALMWIAALRIILATRDRGPVPQAPGPAAVPPRSQPQPA